MRVPQAPPAQAWETGLERWPEITATQAVQADGRR